MFPLYRSAQNTRREIMWTISRRNWPCVFISAKTNDSGFSNPSFVKTLSHESSTVTVATHPAAIELSITTMCDFCGRFLGEGSNVDMSKPFSWLTARSSHFGRWVKTIAPQSRRS
jgi:hypothetical protein